MMKILYNLFRNPLVEHNPIKKFHKQHLLMKKLYGTPLISGVCAPAVLVQTLSPVGRATECGNDRDIELGLVS